MDGAELLIGIVLMVTGVALIVVAVFRALGHAWALGLYELWALPTAGVCLVLLGRGMLA